MQVVCEQRVSSREVLVSAARRPQDLQWVDPGADQRWDAALPSSEHVFFHTSAWAKVLRDSYGCRAMYVATRGQGGFEPLLPLMELNSAITGRRGVCLPFTDECAALPSSNDQTHGLSEFVVSLARARKWKYVEWRGTKPALKGAVPSLSFYTHDLELSNNDDAALNRCDSSVRRAVRKAETEGVEIQISESHEALRAYYRLHCRTRKRHGVPPQPWGFFENIGRHVLSSGRGIVVLAFYRQQPIAGAVFFHAGRSAVYKYGASNGKFQHLRPNNLVMWRAVQWYGQHGFSALNFGRSSFANEGLCRFKASFGARSRLLNYYKYDLGRERFLREIDRASGWHSPILRRMPLSLLRLLGAFLYPHWD